MVGWNNAEDLSFPGLLALVSFSILVPGAIAVMGGYRIAPALEAVWRCTYSTKGVVDAREMLTDPQTGETGLAVSVRFQVDSQRYTCNEWSPGRTLLHDSANVDLFFYESGSQQIVYYDLDDPDMAVLKRVPPPDILIWAAVCVVMGLFGLLMPVTFGLRFQRNVDLFGGAGAAFLLVWTLALAGALIVFMPRLESLVLSYL